MTCIKHTYVGLLDYNLWAWIEALLRFEHVGLHFVLFATLTKGKELPELLHVLSMPRVNNFPTICLQLDSEIFCDDNNSLEVVPTIYL
jgi:hypothetical protein